MEPTPTSARYEPLFKLASGGMATVYVGAARGALGFRQLVAIKRPHAHLLEDPSYRRELIAEARLASLIHHANVVDIRDVEIDGPNISLVMDYIEGASLGELVVAASRRGERVPPAVIVRIVLDACAGLQAAHELIDERGRPVGLVHRDISPQNILVGTDGVGRVSDFGVAKLTEGLSTTQGALKGKLAYMAPEYLRNEKIDRRLDIFAMGVVLWEALAGARLFRGEHEADTFRKVLADIAPPVSQVAPELGTVLDSVVATALAKSRDERFANIQAMATALESSAAPHGLVARHADVAAVVADLVGGALAERRQKVRDKLSQEPSVLSLMGVDSPVANLPMPPASNPIALGDTLPEPRLTPVTQRALTPPQTASSDLLAGEPSRGYDPVEIPGVRGGGGSSRRWAIVGGLAAGALAVVGVIALIRARPAEPPTTDRSANTSTSVSVGVGVDAGVGASVGASVGVGVGVGVSVDAGVGVAAHPSVGPTVGTSVHPHVGTSAGVGARSDAGMAPHPSAGPPPNPYN